jgi:hypothetical protein
MSYSVLVVVRGLCWEHATFLLFATTAVTVIDTCSLVVWGSRPCAIEAHECETLTGGQSFETPTKD